MIAKTLLLKIVSRYRSSLESGTIIDFTESLDSDIILLTDRRRIYYLPSDVDLPLEDLEDIGMLG